MRYILCCLSFLLLLTGCDLMGPGPGPVAPTAPPVPTAVPIPPTPPSKVIGLSGTGNQDTKAFTLTAGDYAVAWRANIAAGAGTCALTAELLTSEKQSQGQIINATITGAAPGGTSIFHQVPAGQYYVSVHTACTTWKITLTPQSP